MTNRLDYTKLTWGELAEVIRSVWHEMKRRNPIGINCYGAPFQTAFAYLVEIEEAEKENPTAEVGPGAFNPVQCLTCNGDGKIMSATGKKRQPLKAIECPDCKGSGKVKL
jgi:hypothetical protein